MRVHVHNTVVDVVSPLLEGFIRFEDCDGYLQIEKAENEFAIGIEFVEGLRDYCNDAIEKYHCEYCKD